MHRRILAILCVLAVVSMMVVGCAGKAKSDAVGQGDAARGKKLYEQTVIGPNAAPGCITCHSTKPGVILVGPSHAGLANRAGNTVSGVSAENYLHESIMNPDAHVTKGFVPGIMYQRYSEDLSEQEINDLVAYMLTLK